MTNFLTKICDYKKEHIVKKKQAFPANKLELSISKNVPPRGFIRSLKLKIDAGKYGLIAELKKASPSKGIIRENFEPTELATQYKSGGACCLSVLTDAKFFQGKDFYLKLIHETVSLPILRKDFILDPYQVLESRALGADCILLIMAALSDNQAIELEDAACLLGLDVLLEVHNETELERAFKLKSKLIGINNRNLKTLKVDISMTEDLAPKVPFDYILVSESGLYTKSDLARMASVGANCFLIGEAFMRQENVELAVKSMLD
jgi:indole-3-glycerol phosphate synthase